MSAKATAATLTGALEDYLETIFQLANERQFARVRDIAKARKVKAGSVSPALKRLAEMGLIDYVQREYIGLTPAGEMAARRVLARHRLLTRFFEEVLRLPSKAAEQEACAMEHSLSNQGMDRLARFFEFLSTCPALPDFLETFHRCPLVQDDAPDCGHECTAKIEREAKRKTMSVYDLKPGQQGKVTHVNARGAVRQRLLDMGVLPDSVIELERKAPTGDPIWIKLLGSQLALRRKEAEAVLVTRD